MDFSKEEGSLAVQVLTLYSKQGAFSLPEYKKVYEVYESLAAVVNETSKQLTIELVVTLYAVFKVACSRKPTELENMEPIASLAAKLRSVIIANEEAKKKQKQETESARVVEL